jgi:hypothetical protein
MSKPEQGFHVTSARTLSMHGHLPALNGMRGNQNTNILKPGSMMRAVLQMLAT